jgi:Right handed beta helix region
VTGEQGNSTLGMICAQTSARVFLKDDVFEDNKQGLVALKAGSLTLERVQMRRTGLVTDNQDVKSFSNAIGANGQGCNVTVAGCTIADSLNDAFFISGGAQLKAVETTITNTTAVGLVLGYANFEAAHAELNNVRFLGSRGDGIWVNAGSQLAMQNCQVTNSDATGIEAEGNSTQIKLVGTTITGCQVMGLNASSGATISASGCTMEATTRGAQAGLPNDATKQGTIFLQDCTVRGNAVFGVGACRGALLEMRGGFLGGNKQNTWHEQSGTVRLGR